MSEFGSTSRGERLQTALSDLLYQVGELEAAAVVTFDGLPMASVLPDGMDEDRVAAMSAALLSLGEKAAHGLGRGDLSQVFVEGEHGTVFLVACESEAVLVAVAALGAKSGLVLYEVRRAAGVMADILTADVPVEHQLGWDAPVIDEREVFGQAIAEAEAAYEAHRAESSIFQRMTDAMPVSDINVVYTPQLAAPQNPAPAPHVRFDQELTSQSPFVSRPIGWVDEGSQNWDAS
jgi:predicted regulator of Ras-like GTPase activity (Roadblock/LC7/MglB family)